MHYEQIVASPRREAGVVCPELVHYEQKMSVTRDQVRGVSSWTLRLGSLWRSKWGGYSTVLIVRLGIRDGQISSWPVPATKQVLCAMSW